MIISKIVGTGMYVPDRVVTNQDLTKWMDTSDEWIKKRSGVEERRWVPEEGGVGPSDLALEATKKALKDANWKKEDIDLIIFGTINPDLFFPGSGCLLQSKLGLNNIPALDIRQQCSAFVYGLSIADAYIKTGAFKKILFVGAEVQSTGLDLSTKGRDIAVLFGDGAGVLCIEAEETDKNIGLLSYSLYADGSYAESLMIEAPTAIAKGRITKEMIDEGRHYPFMDGNLIFKLAVTKLVEVIKESVEKANLKISDIDVVVPHQANLRINQFVQKTLGMPEGSFINNINKYGNTTAATIPIALDEALKDGRIDKSGSNVVFASFGAGLTWGSAVYRFG